MSYSNILNIKESYKTLLKKYQNVWDSLGIFYDVIYTLTHVKYMFYIFRINYYGVEFDTEAYLSGDIFYRKRTDLFSIYEHNHKLKYIINYKPILYKQRLKIKERKFTYIFLGLKEYKFKVLKIYKLNLSKVFKKINPFKSLLNIFLVKNKTNKQKINKFLINKNYINSFYLLKYTLNIVFSYNKNKNTKYLKPVYTVFFFLKNILVSLFFSVFFILFSFYFFKLSFLKTTSYWTCFGLFGFWFFSTFNFFLKRYKYGKYTTAIQRFWKRAFMCFWVIEGFLFSILMYYLLNASSEPYFMYDTYGLYNNNSAQFSIINIDNLFIFILVNFFLYLLINLKYNSLKKNITILFFLTLILIYILVKESYQFYYIVSYYSDYFWIFSEQETTDKLESLWELDLNTPRSRNKQHYVTLIIVAKFWHYVFIFISWVFFIMKSLEYNRLRYNLLSMNLQNILMYTLLSFWCYFDSLKFIFRNFLDQTYYWFFTSYRPNNVNILIYDLTSRLLNINKLSNFIFKKEINFFFFYHTNTNINTYNHSSGFNFLFNNLFNF